MKNDYIRYNQITVKIVYNELIQRIKLKKRLNRPVEEKIENKCSEKIKKYFEKRKKEINCKINPKKLTNYQKMVLKEIKKIPYGETRTYGQIAQKMNKNTHPLAIGQVLSKNPFPLIFPCHRVVKKDQLGGYRFSKEIKKTLLNHEEPHP